MGGSCKFKLEKIIQNSGLRFFFYYWLSNASNGKLLDWWGRGWWRGLPAAAIHHCTLNQCRSTIHYLTYMNQCSSTSHLWTSAGQPVTYEPACYCNCLWTSMPSLEVPMIQHILELHIWFSQCSWLLGVWSTHYYRWETYI